MVRWRMSGQQDFATVGVKSQIEQVALPYRFCDQPVRRRHPEGHLAQFTASTGSHYTPTERISGIHQTSSFLWQPIRRLCPPSSVTYSGRKVARRGGHPTLTMGYFLLRTDEKVSTPPLASVQVSGSTLVA